MGAAPAPTSLGRWAWVLAVAGALAAGLLLTLAPPVAAQSKTGRDTGLPIPRFVSLRADTVNMRAGPGLRYPIEWVYKRQGLPVAVLQEFNAWRKVRAADGTVGWVHTALLDGRRTAQVVGGSPRALLREPAETANTVALVQPGAIGELDGCEDGYCHVDLGNHSGWLRQQDIYGVLPNDLRD